MTEELESREVMEEPSRRSEGVKFVVLAVIMLGAVLVVAVLRPFIFNHIVPAVMGEGMVPPAPQDEAPIELLIPVVTDGPAAADEEMVVPVEEAYPAPAEEPAATDETIVFPAIVGEEETAVSSETAVLTIDHVVQPGENLTTIAAKYNITVQDIIDANTIPDPNSIEAGTLLYIPQP